MNEKKKTRLDWHISQSDIYSVGYTTLSFLQFIGACGIFIFGFTLIMQFRHPKMDKIFIGIAMTSLSLLVWRSATKKLDAVGPEGKSLSYSPFKGPDDPIF